MPGKPVLKRLWRAIIDFLNAPVAEIDGCRNCKHAGFDGHGMGVCVRVTGSRAWQMSSGMIYEALPYRAEECEAWERKEGETK